MATLPTATVAPTPAEQIVAKMDTVRADMNNIVEEMKRTIVFQDLDTAG